MAVPGGGLFLMGEVPLYVVLMLNPHQVLAESAPKKRKEGKEAKEGETPGGMAGQVMAVLWEKGAGFAPPGPKLEVRTATGVPRLYETPPS